MSTENNNKQNQTAATEKGSILASEVKALLKSKTVTQALIEQCAAAYLNSGKNRVQKIAAFMEGRWLEVSTNVTEDHAPELTAMGFTHTKSKLKISGNHRITSVIDVPTILDAMPLVEQVALHGFAFVEIQPSAVNVGKFTLTVKKEWAEETPASE